MKQMLFYIIATCLLQFGASAQKTLQSAQWVSAFIDSSNICPVFRKQVVLNKTVKQATLYITAHGIYEADINGKRVAMDYFTPGFTPYDKELFYNTYDVTALIKQKNQITATVGPGWYRGIFGPHSSYPGRPDIYGKDASLLAKLVIKYKDGTSDIIQTDSSWQCGTGSIINDRGIYYGETIDNNVRPHGWRKVKVSGISRVNLQPYPMEPVTEQERFSAKRIFKDQLGNTIVDFGQNMAGWVRLNLQGYKGDTIKIHHFETLDTHDNYFTGNLLHADPTDIYILNGHGTEILEPHFTYHGFRYAKVEGFIPTKTNCIAIAVHTNLRHTGAFTCSDALVNKLQHNIEWSLNSNFLEIPTDCPQRGECMGWTGDAQLFFRTAAINRNVQKFFDKWLNDLILEQGTNGGVPKVIPDTYMPNLKGTKGVCIAGWGDAATIIPMDYYEVYGATVLLRRQYPSMKAWVKYVQTHVDQTDHLWKDGTYGDSFAVGPETSDIYLDQSYMIHSLELLLKAKAILNIAEPDSDIFKKELSMAKTAWFKTFISKGKLNENTQTACVLALHFDLLPDSLKANIAEQLADLIHQNNDHLATGFLGTPYLLEELSKNGYAKLAYTLLEQKTMPSWLYEVTHGATTIWEKWDPYKDANYDIYSLNHYANGAVGNWLYTFVAGISPATPAYKKILIEPHPGGGLTWAKGSYRCNYGTIISHWQFKGKTILYHVEIPKGTTALLRLPGQKDKMIESGKYNFRGRI